MTTTAEPTPTRLPHPSTHHQNSDEQYHNADTIHTLCESGPHHQKKHGSSGRRRSFGRFTIDILSPILYPNNGSEFKSIGVSHARVRTVRQIAAVQKLRSGNVSLVRVTLLPQLPPQRTTAVTLHQKEPPRSMPSEPPHLRRLLPVAATTHHHQSHRWIIPRRSMSHESLVVDS